MLCIVLDLTREHCGLYLCTNYVYEVKRFILKIYYCFLKNKTNQKTVILYVVNISFHFKNYLCVEANKLLFNSQSYSTTGKRLVVSDLCLMYTDLNTFLNGFEYASTPLKLTKELYLHVLVFAPLQDHGLECL